ncbi:PH domain-containing protein [Candidatus Uhrbacteria bacterium]|nr:PH domain-containing protein [Candidatus Uhrbacteria bacterium]
MHLGHLIQQKGYERIVYLLRRHPLILLRSVFVFIVLAAVPILAFFFFSSSLPLYLSQPVLRVIIILGTSIYLLSVWLFIFSAFLDYYLDLWIVTNDRIMNIEQHGLFGRTISELDLTKIQDVTSEIKGIVATLFNYGEVHIQTAGEEKRFVFEQVPNPHEIRKGILDLMEEDRKRQAAEIIEEIRPS